MPLKFDPDRKEFVPVNAPDRPPSESGCTRSSEPPGRAARQASSAALPDTEKEDTLRVISTKQTRTRTSRARQGTYYFWVLTGAVLGGFILLSTLFFMFREHDSADKGSVRDANKAPDALEDLLLK